MISCRDVIDAVLSARHRAAVRRVRRTCSSILWTAPCAAAAGDRLLSAGSATPASRAIAQTAAIGAYDGTLREILHALKYDRRRSVAPASLATDVGVRRARFLPAPTACVPVPLHRRRDAPARVQSGGTTSHAGSACRSCAALRRVRQTRPQVELPAAERQSNVPMRLRSARFGSRSATWPAEKSSCWWTMWRRRARRSRRARGCCRRRARARCARLQQPESRRHGRLRQLRVTASLSLRAVDALPRRLRRPAGRSCRARAPSSARSRS